MAKNRSHVNENDPDTDNAIVSPGLMPDWNHDGKPRGKKEQGP